MPLRAPPRADLGPRSAPLASRANDHTISAWAGGQAHRRLDRMPVAGRIHEGIWNIGAPLLELSSLLTGDSHIALPLR